MNDSTPFLSHGSKNLIDYLGRVLRPTFFDRVSDPPARGVAALQHSEQFSPPSLIGPCTHTILNQDLIVPFEGFEDGLTGRFLMQRGRLWGEAASFFHGLSGQGFGGWGSRSAPPLNDTAVSNKLN
jgi:hypothetical protein